MLWNPKVLPDTLKRVFHVNWVILGMSNTPLMARTKIIEPTVFGDYPKQGISFFIGFDMIMQYPSMFL